MNISFYKEDRAVRLRRGLEKNGKNKEFISYALCKKFGNPYIDCAMCLISSICDESDQEDKEE